MSNVSDRGAGIGEEWDPIPARFRAEVLTARYGPEDHAPERDGWLFCWTLTKEGRPPTIREMMQWTGWGNTKSKRVHAEVAVAFKTWKSGSATKKRTAATQTRDHDQDTRPKANAESQPTERPRATQGGDHPQDDRGRVLLDTPTDTSKTIAAAVAAAVDDGLDVEVVLKPPRKEPSGAYHGAIRTWDVEHAEAFGLVAYPWEFPHPDAARVKRWLRTAKVSEDEPAVGLARLRVACRVYFAAVKAGTSWPLGDPATTKHFTNDLAKWLRTDPEHVPRDGPSKTLEEAKQRWGFGGS